MCEEFWCADPWRCHREPWRLGRSRCVGRTRTQAVGSAIVSPLHILTSHSALPRAPPPAASAKCFMAKLCQPACAGCEQREEGWTREHQCEVGTRDQVRQGIAGIQDRAEVPATGQRYAVLCLLVLSVRSCHNVNTSALPYILWNVASRLVQTRVPFGLGSGCGYCLCGRVPIWSLSPLSVILITQFCPSAGNIGLGTACGKTRCFVHQL